MRKDSRRSADRSTDAEEHAGWLKGFIARDDAMDRRTLWRIGFWGIGATAMLAFAIAVNQLPFGARTMHGAAAELAIKAQRAQELAEDSRLEGRRLFAAIETLNNDRDRTFGRLSALEQGLESVTGSISQQKKPPSAGVPSPSVAASAGAAQALPPAEIKPPEDAATQPPAQPSPAPAPVALLKPVAPVPVHSAGAVTTVSEIARSAEPPAEAANDAAASVPVGQTQFGVDIGGAKSVAALRLIWKAAREAHAAELGQLYPVIAVRERGKAGIQLRLVAGPIRNAAAAQRLCARISENIAGCDATVFDGQRLDIPVETPRPKVVRRQLKAG